MSLTSKMAAVHETWLAGVLGGRRTKSSGNQFNDQMDVREDRYLHEFAFAADGKATRGKSISVSLDMVNKAKEQAHGERWLLALRFYPNDKLKDPIDVFVCDPNDFLHMRELARENLTFGVARDADDTD